MAQNEIMLCGVRDAGACREKKSLSLSTPFSQF
jgi:hypothetical protein